MVKIWDREEKMQREKGAKDSEIHHERGQNETILEHQIGNASQVPS